MEVKVLGSVSPYCDKNHNGPGFLVTSGDNKILLDCGPGSTSLLDMEQDLKNLTIIISHLHRDHYSDLISSIAYTSYVHHNLGLLDQKVKVYIPKPDYYNDYENYTNQYGHYDYKLVSKPILDYQLLTNLGEESYLDIQTYSTDSKIQIGDVTATFAYNPHNIRSHAIKLDNGAEIIVYSGDTGYEHNNITKLAKKCNLLICESTFLRGQSKGTKDYHLYAHEAAKIASIAKPDLLMLTHFWPTIDKQKYVDEALPIFPNTIPAEEGHILKLTRN
ncbi:MAG: hypothetical protein K2H20_01715 [Bacilli bacterium]|nr:hypothetical protein [Bacilli bacterium]